MSTTSGSSSITRILAVGTLTIAATSRRLPRRLRSVIGYQAGSSEISLYGARISARRSRPSSTPGPGRFTMPAGNSHTRPDLTAVTRSHPSRLTRESRVALPGYVAITITSGSRRRTVAVGSTGHSNAHERECYRHYLVDGGDRDPT